MGELTGLMRELVGEVKELKSGMRGIAGELRNLGEMAGAWAWGRDPEEDAEDYEVWLEEWDREEYQREIADLEVEKEFYREAVREHMQRAVFPWLEDGEVVEEEEDEEVNEEGVVREGETVE